MSTLPTGTGVSPDDRQQRRQPVRQRHAAARDTDQHHFGAVAIAAGYLPRHLAQGAFHALRIQQQGVPGQVRGCHAKVFVRLNAAGEILVITAFPTLPIFLVLLVLLVLT